MFELTGLLAQSNGAVGDFLTYPLGNIFKRDMGDTTLNLSNVGAFTFGNSFFGSFTGSTATIIANTPGTLGIYVLGTYTPGSTLSTHGIAAPSAASLTISFTQTPATTGSISASATLATPPAPITATPEPSTVIGLISGVAAVAFARLRRKTA